MRQYEFRWYKSYDDDSFTLQVRVTEGEGAQIQIGAWEAIPLVLEGVGKI